MGIDRPDDADVPSEGHSDRSPDRADAPGDSRPPPDPQAETRSRQEYYDDLRAAAAAEERTELRGGSEPGAQSKAEEQAESGQQAQDGSSWEEKADQFNWMWGEYKRRWPEQCQSEDGVSDSQASGREDSNEFWDSTRTDELDKECDRIANLERETISPAMREVESRDPDRQLVGFEFCLKGRDRIKEKIYDDINLLGRSAHEAISLLPDALRYTFRYDDARYSQGVLMDIVRMKEQGFELLKLKNFWSDDQYKGVNSQWIEPVSGQRFELQFHTRISFEAKQITHAAYERLRTKQADVFEELVLEAFQGKVAAAVPVPPGTTDIPEYPEGEQHAR